MTGGAVTRQSLAADFATIGLKAGDAVLAHAALRRIGPIVGGPDMVVAAMLDTLGTEGTILAYTDWLGADDLDDPALRPHFPPFDPKSSRGARENGFFPEMLRTTPGALRSASPGASCAALGAQAEWFVADHAMDYGYGPHSPFGKLVEAGGKVLMLGAPLDTMTLLHHAEHLAVFAPKRIIRYEAPILVGGRTVWRKFEEFDTAEVPHGLADDYFATIVEDFLATGKGRRSTIGAAPSVLVDAKQIVPFAIRWIEAALRSVS
ncbi:MAG: aminoglycoside 3-N-acetyltransferase [Devosia sp.]